MQKIKQLTFLQVWSMNHMHLNDLGISVKNTAIWTLPDLLNLHLCKWVQEAEIVFIFFLKKSRSLVDNSKELHHLRLTKLPGRQ